METNKQPGVVGEGRFGTRRDAQWTRGCGCGCRYVACLPSVDWHYAGAVRYERATVAVVAVRCVTGWLVDGVVWILLLLLTGDDCGGCD